MNSEYRAPRLNQQREKEFSLFKSVSMVFCTFAQVRNREQLFCFEQTLERTTKQQLQNRKPQLARSLRACRLAGNNEIQLQPSKASSLTLEGDGEAITFPSGWMSFSLCFSLSVYLVFVLWFSVFFSFCLHFSQARIRGQENFQSRMGAIGIRTRCVNCCTRTGARIAISICVNEGYNLYHVPACPLRDTYCCFSLLAAFL